MENQCPVRASSRVPEGSAKYVQLGNRKVGYSLTQASEALASRGEGNGSAFSMRAQSSGEEAAPREGRSMATTNPFRARLAARQAQSPRENAPIY